MSVKIMVGLRIEHLPVERRLGHTDRQTAPSVFLPTSFLQKFHPALQPTPIVEHPRKSTARGVSFFFFMSAAVLYCLVLKPCHNSKDRRGEDGTTLNQAKPATRTRAKLPADLLSEA